MLIAWIEGNSSRFSTRRNKWRYSCPTNKSKHEGRWYKGRENQSERGSNPDEVLIHERGTLKRAYNKSAKRFGWGNYIHRVHKKGS